MINVWAADNGRPVFLEAPMPTLRLDKIIADTGLFSRSEAASLIKHGRVTVDDRIVCSGAEKFDTEARRFAIDGQQLDYRKKRYIMLNKPKGYVSSTEDKRDVTVMQLLDERYSRLGLFPVGRLDKDAEGLLLLTNDGDFAHEITSPGKKVDKTYFVQFDGEVSKNDIEAFSRGITLGDGTKCMPAILEPKSDGAFVTINEGKYHQVKRMFAAINKPVRNLRRISTGGLILDERLKPGEYRELSHEDIFLLFK